MNIDDHVEASLAFFAAEAGILDEILLIGAWARYFYRGIFTDQARYTARMATKDLDVLIQRKKKREARKVDVHQKLLDAGYGSRHFQSNLIKYYRDDLEIEFLLPSAGLPSDKAVDVKAYNLKAQELPFLDMLWKDPVSVRYGQHKVWVPNPMVFALHKLIVAERRSTVASARQDLQDAEEVFYSLQEEPDFEEKLRERLEGIRKKQIKTIQRGIETFLLPDLRTKLLDQMGDV